MRIAYVTPYQGPTLVERRPIVRNRSMSNRTKIELIARLLRSNGHEVAVFSHGEVIENRLKFYPGFTESKRFDSEIPVSYISALPIRRVNGLWASLRMVQLLRKQHRMAPLDLVIIFNLKPPQIAAARYAARHGIPVVLEYEDDVFRGVTGETSHGLISLWHERTYRSVLSAVSGSIAASPHLLSQVRAGVPKLLLRGVVGDDILNASEQRLPKRNIVLFAGTHTKSNGIEELITAWGEMRLCGWELHITGYGDLTDKLRRMAQNARGISFHGLVSRADLVALMCSAKICINPHSVSRMPGNVFAFKIIEYLAAGAHVITTPMGVLESEIEKGITYMPDNNPRTIAAAVSDVIHQRRYGHAAEFAAREAYGPDSVAKALDTFIHEVLSRGTRGGDS